MIKPISQKITEEAVARVRSLKSDKIYSLAMGDYKGWVSGQKAFATEVVGNYALAKDVNSPQIRGIPLFSKMGMRIFAMMFKNMFRKKTADEKYLKEIVKNDKILTDAVNKIDKIIKNRLGENLIRSQRKYISN